MNTESETPHIRVRPHEGIPSSEKASPEFVKGMTHDLRTPLNVIIGLCQLLERDRETPLSPEQRDSVDRMERNAHTLLQTVNRLLVCLNSGRME